MFEYGDVVRVISTGEIGEICDISETVGNKKYIIDRQPYTKSDDADEWLVEAKESEIEYA